MIISFLIELIKLGSIAILFLIHLIGIIKNTYHILQNKARYYNKFLMFRTDLVKIDNEFKKGTADMAAVYNIYLTSVHDFFLSIRNDYRYKIVNKLSEYSEYNSFINILTDNTHDDPQIESKELKDEAIDLKYAFELHDLDIKIFREIYTQQLRMKISRDILNIVYEYYRYKKFGDKLVKSYTKNINKYVLESMERCTITPPNRR